MGLKQHDYLTDARKQFDSGVILYGTETLKSVISLCVWFDSGVILYGTETMTSCTVHAPPFDSGVILYGTETLQ